jgi:hypothetical protein
VDTVLTVDLFKQKLDFLEAEENAKQFTPSKGT